jgi:hypothetical protein
MAFSLATGSLQPDMSKHDDESREISFTQIQLVLHHAINVTDACGTRRAPEHI